MNGDTYVQTDTLPMPNPETGRLLLEESPEGSSGLLSSFSELGEILSAGGPVVALLLVLSVIALSVILLKFYQFNRLHLGRTRPLEQALGLYLKGDTAAAMRLLDSSRHPAATPLQAAIRGMNRADLSQQLVREEVERIAGENLNALRAHLRILEVIGSLSPLLGLFGTVLGMIAAFQQLELAGNQVNPSVLSGGIWEALLTTAVGLAVAIPAILALSWFERRVDHCTHIIESSVTRVFTRPFYSTESNHDPRQLHDVARSRLQPAE